jgi:hypothetical protein
MIAIQNNREEVFNYLVYKLNVDLDYSSSINETDMFVEKHHIIAYLKYLEDKKEKEKKPETGFDKIAKILDKMDSYGEDKEAEIVKRAGSILERCEYTSLYLAVLGC